METRSLPVRDGPFPESETMAMFWVILAVVVTIVVGNALVLLRTAKKPKIPETGKPKPYQDDEDDW